MDEQSARPSNDHLTVGDRLGGSVGALEIRRGGGGREKIPYHSKVRGDLEEEFHTMPYHAMSWYREAQKIPYHSAGRPRKSAVDIRCLVMDSPAEANHRLSEDPLSLA